MSVLVILAIAMTVFLGSLTRATFGFGEAVVSMPILALLPIHWHTAIALMGLVSLTVAAVTVTADWRHIRRQDLVPVVPAALVGIPVGLWLVTSLSPNLVTGWLGISLAGYGIYSLWHPQVTADAAYTPHPLWGLAFGFASGVLGSAYNFTGIPVAIYGSLRKWPPQNFRSTMQAYFLITGPLIAAGQGMTGLWTQQMLTLYLWSLPAIAAAIVAGTFLHHKIPTAQFHRGLFLLVTALGAIMLVKSAI